VGQWGPWRCWKVGLGRVGYWGLFSCEAAKIVELWESRDCGILGTVRLWGSEKC
jgi:hypothetical protein